MVLKEYKVTLPIKLTNPFILMVLTTTMTCRKSYTYCIAKQFLVFASVRVKKTMMKFNLLQAIFRSHLASCSTSSVEVSI